MRITFFSQTEFGHFTVFPTFLKQTIFFSKKISSISTPPTRMGQVFFAQSTIKALLIVNEKKLINKNPYSNYILREGKGVELKKLFE